MTKYLPETVDFGYEDSTMTDNVAQLSEAVVGHRIVSVETTERKRNWSTEKVTILTLDNGKQVELLDSGDCCAYTELQAFLLHPDKVDHVIMGVGTTDYFTKWHIYADMGDVLELTVGWSEGSGYYGYGFEINVKDPD